MGIDLPIVWAVIILFGVMMYVVMDGFDLGIGLLYPFFRGKDDRDVMMNTVAPVWDGNETWLVLGGAGLLAAFPTAYAVVLSAFYLPLIGMLIGLIFRGVAFEFRFKASAARRGWWDKAFIGGSLLATPGGDSALRLWDPATGEERAEFGFPAGGEVWGPSFSPDGSRVGASWPETNVVRMFDVGVRREVWAVASLRVKP